MSLGKDFVEEKEMAERLANDMANDNRFEVIGKAKEHLLEATNIDTSPDEMAVLDSFLFRCWQMGWLKQYGAEPVRHGKWEYAEDEVLDDLTFSAWKCSCCGYYAYKPELWHYCPKCGAKMDGE